MKVTTPKAAAIHDLSGFGRTSLNVVTPVLSSMGIHVCPLPTAVLSTHTGGYADYVFIDLTDKLPEIIDHWEKLGLSFDLIYSGFLGSAKQVNIVKSFIRQFAKSDAIVVIDPVLGDNGKLYDTMDQKMVSNMTDLIRQANVITPNFTEVCYLLNKPYTERISHDELKSWLDELSQNGPECVVITSIPTAEKKTTVIAYNRLDNRYWKVTCDYIPAHYPGTGDLFASVVAGSLLQGDSLPIAIDRAVQFVSISIKATFGYRNYDTREGVLLEKVLPNLSAPVTTSTYELFD